MVRQVTYWAVVSVAALLLVLWIVSGPLLGISGVTVAGYSGPDGAEVQETAELVAGTGSMVRLPAGDMRRALTRFPGVLDATIERDWPRSITVEVTMGEPVAILAVDSGGRYLLSPSGQVMGDARTGAGLPVIRVGSYPPGGVLAGPGQRAALTFIGWLPPDVAVRIRDLHAEDGGLKARLSNGLEIRIGPMTKLAEKAQALAAVVSQADPKALAAAAYLDISRPARPMLGSRVVTGPGTGSVDGTSTTGGMDTTGATETTGGVSPDGVSGGADGTGTTLDP